MRWTPTASRPLRTRSRASDERGPAPARHCGEGPRAADEVQSLRVSLAVLVLAVCESPTGSLRPQQGYDDDERKNEHRYHDRPTAPAQFGVPARMEAER